MMQTLDSFNQNSLFNAMSRFIGAVNNMDQTVMVPSLLRDVPLDHGEELRAPQASGYFQDGDMYSSYVLLKSIRNDMEWGVLQGDGGPREDRDKMEDRDSVENREKVENQEKVKNRDKVEEVQPAEAEGDDLEKQFHFHLNGLHAVLSKLTLKANTLTNRYKEEIGCRN